MAPLELDALRLIKSSATSGWRSPYSCCCIASSAPVQGIGDGIFAQLEVRIGEFGEAGRQIGSRRAGRRLEADGFVQQRMACA